MDESQFYQKIDISEIDWNKIFRDLPTQKIMCSNCGWTLKCRGRLKDGEQCPNCKYYKLFVVKN